MVRIGKVEGTLIREIRKRNCIHIALFDPDTLPPEPARKIAKECYELGSTALMIGGSLGITEGELDGYIRVLKRACPLPVILFPGSLAGLSKYADAVWFMSILNSENPYYISGAQALGAPLVRKMGIEPIPLAYIIVADGGAAGYVGRARPIPYNRPEILAAYSLAAQYMGMRFIYLEAGSGAPIPIPPKIVSYLRRTTELPIIVGGGINTRQTAHDLVKAGANIIVTGTLLEHEKNAKMRLRGVMRGIEEAVYAQRAKRRND